MFSEIYLKYYIQDEIQSLCRQYMNLALNYNDMKLLLYYFDLPVTSLSAVCAPQTVN